MPALMNSSVGSLAGMIEADSIRVCRLSVKKRRKVSRISSLPVGPLMRPVCWQLRGRATSYFPALQFDLAADARDRPAADPDRAVVVLGHVDPALAAQRGALAGHVRRGDPAGGQQPP